MRRALAVLPLLIVLGCSSAGSPSASPSTPAPSRSATTQDPVELVGLWTVTTAESDPTVPTSHTISALRLGSGLIGFARCGQYLGEWSADPSGSFVASPSGGSGSCFENHPGSIGFPSWLDQATAYRLDGAAVELLDAQHTILARLTPGADVGSRPDIADELTLPPTPDATLRARLKAAVVPPGSREVTVSDIVGRWLPAPVRHYPAGQPHVTFKADGTWEGLDGCNGQGGRWLLEPDAAVLTTSGPQTLIGCPGVSVGGWVAKARSMRLHDGALLLYDTGGDLLGTLVRG